MSRISDDDYPALSPVSRRSKPGGAGNGRLRRSPVVRVEDYVARKPVDPHLHGGEPKRKDESFLREAPPSKDRATVADTKQDQHQGDAARPGPILDIRTILRAVWTHRLLILLLAAALAVLGGLLVPAMPKKYTAQTSLYFDPRQIELTDTSSQASVSSEAIIAMINSQTKILTSQKVMDEVVRKLDLAREPAFARMEGNLSAIVESLQRSTSIALQANSYVATVSVTTGDPQLSATVANSLVETFLAEENRAYSDLYQTTNTALDSRLRELSEEVQRAEEAVETYKASNNMVTADGSLISDQRLVQLNELLLTAQKATIEAKAKVDAASKLRLEDAVSNSNQTEISSTLTDLRRQYATQASTVGSLQSSMGARHPTLLAAKASLEGLAREIRAELQRIVAQARADLARAQEAEQQIAKELAVQKTLQGDTQQRQVGLNDLQRRATAAREIYEAVLKRARETSEEKNLVRNNIRVLSEATPPLKADGPGRTVLTAAGVLSGAMLGFGIGLSIALLRSLLRNPRLRAGLADLTRPD